jgi:hypothetical protein
MTQIELVTKLIAHYRECIDEVKTSDNIDVTLFKYRTYSGICCCAKEIFGGTLDKWIFDYVDDKMTLPYWGPTPDDVVSREGVIAALQLRIDKMEDYLKKQTT